MLPEYRLLTSLECVMLFHSTAPQCFISGFAAVSFHQKLTSRNLSVAWPLNDLSRERGFITPQEEKNTEATRKYVSKGFTYVDMERTGTTRGRFGGFPRHIGDSECWIVPFDKYIDTSTEPLQVGPIRPCLEKYMESLQYLSWMEMDGCNVVTGNPLSDYANMVDSVPQFHALSDLSTWTRRGPRRPRRWETLINTREPRRLQYNPC
jgi:hypothetical protein